MIRLLLPLLALATAIWASRLVNPSELGARIDRIEAWIRLWRGGPLAAAIVTMALMWWTWGSLTPPPMTHDEASYVLQAGIFAHGAWTAPAPALPEFFEQPAVLVTPAVASAFPPGHALLLAAGALLRFPALVPLLVAGFTAALIIVVGSRVANPWVALLAWLIWLTTPLVLRFQPGYFAESTTTLCVLAAWWCLLRWRDGRNWFWAAGAALAAGWGAITQPVTMLAFGLPLVAVLLVDAVRGRHWLALVVFVAVAGAMAGVYPLWNTKTTGDRSLSPATLYAADYLPLDRPAFAMDDAAPRRALTPVLESMREDLERQRAALAPRRLALTVARRLAAVAGDIWQGAQLVLLPFFVVGLFALRGKGRRTRGGGAQRGAVRDSGSGGGAAGGESGAAGPLSTALACCVLLIVARMAYPRDSAWTLPYLAIVPVVAGVTALGVWSVLVWATRGVVIRLHVERRPKLGAALVALVLVFFAVPTLGGWRLRHQQTSGVRAAFDEAMQQLPSSKSIVFLRYADRHQHLSLVLNSPDLAAEPVWVVHDLGARNRELLALAQDRTAYVFDEESMEFRRY